MSRGVRGSLAAIGACAALAMGCGDGDGSSDEAGKDAPTPSVAAEGASAFVNRLAKLLETTAKPEECGDLEAINRRSLTRFPCPPSKGVAASMSRFEVVGADEYGTGAVVDYKSGEAKDGAAIVLFVATDRNWAISRYGVVTKPSVGTSDAGSRAGFRKAVDNYLQAIRDRDCRKFVAVAVTDAPDEKVCRSTFDPSSALAKRLEQNQGATPKYEGGNSTYGFFSLETTRPKPESSTLSVVRSGGTYLVLDVAPSPTAAVQRQVIERLQKRLRADR
jgi:hypothetical protein